MKAEQRGVARKRSGGKGKGQSGRKEAGGWNKIETRTAHTHVELLSSKETNWKKSAKFQFDVDAKC